MSKGSISPPTRLGVNLKNLHCLIKLSRKFLFLKRPNFFELCALLVKLNHDIISKYFVTSPLACLFVLRPTIRLFQSISGQTECLWVYVSIMT